MTAFTSNLTDLIIPYDGAGLALAFAGAQGVSLGNLGNFGSSMSGGVYMILKIKTTQITSVSFGRNSINGRLTLGLNQNHLQSNGSGKLNFYITDNLGNSILAGVDSNTGFNDGKVHTIEITANVSARTVVFKVDGVTKTTVYNLQNTLSNLINFNSTWTLGAGGFIGTIDDFKLGITSSNIYVAYNFDDGASPVTDQTVNGNNGTLTGSPTPIYVLGLNNINKDVSKFLSGSTTLTEIFTFSGTYLKEVLITNTINLVESFKRNYATALTDNTILSDSLAYVGQLIRSFTETITLVSTLTRDMARAFSSRVSLYDGTNFGLQFDGVQNYVSLNKLGTLGVDMNAGFYMKFKIKTTQTTPFAWGLNTNSGRVTIGFNQNHIQAAGIGKLLVYISDSAGQQLIGGVDLNTGFNNGVLNTIEISVNFSTQTITIKKNNITQGITYNIRNTLTHLVTFTQNFFVGAQAGLTGNPGNFGNAMVDDLIIGVSPTNIYGSYDFNDGFDISHDISGNNRTATLIGPSGLPQYIFLNSIIQKDITKAYNETINLIEFFVKKPLRAFTDSIDLIEVFIKNIILKFFDKGPSFHLLLEGGGGYLLLEDGSRIALEGGSISYKEFFSFNAISHRIKRLRRFMEAIVKDNQA